MTKSSTVLKNQETKRSEDLRLVSPIEITKEVFKKERDKKGGEKRREGNFSWKIRPKALWKPLSTIDHDSNRIGSWQYDIRDQGDRLSLVG